MLKYTVVFDESKSLFSRLHFIALDRSLSDLAKASALKTVNARAWPIFSRCCAYAPPRKIA